MAIKLGNYNINRELEITAKEQEIKIKREHIFALLEKANPFVDDITDMYDTFYYLKDEKSTKKEFVNGLWEYLNHCELTINSYFCLKSKRNIYHTPCVSRFGIAIMYDCFEEHLMTNNPSLDVNKRDKNVWSGKYSFEQYLNETTIIPTKVLDTYIFCLEDIIVNFPKVRDKFFDLVSKCETYKR